MLRRGRALAEGSGDGQAFLWLVMIESDAMRCLRKFESAAGVALRGLQAARQTGRQATFEAACLAGSAADAMLARGCTAKAAALIGPLAGTCLILDS